MTKYEQPTLDLIMLGQARDIVTLSLGDNDPGEGDDWWGTE